jgi:hypothetical protein
VAVSVTTIPAAAYCGVAVGLGERGAALGDLEVLATNVAMLVVAALGTLVLQRPWRDVPSSSQSVEWPSASEAPRPERASGKFAHRLASEHLGAGKRERKQNQEGYTGWPSVGPVRRVVGSSDGDDRRLRRRDASAYLRSDRRSVRDAPGHRLAGDPRGAITSTFVASEEREQAEAREEESGEERIDARFDDLAARLDRLEGMIARLIGP